MGSSHTDYAVKMVERALELGVNYFDTARGYWDSEIKLGLALRGQRERALISTKTGAKKKDEAWQHIRESLERLQVEYVDNCHLHGLWEGEDLETRLGPGGALEALREAKERGLVRHIGCSSHRSRALIEALGRFDFEVILVPMNIVEREPLDELIPLCLKKGVGITIMKPVATGLLPAKLALQWLLNQPIATAVPGATTLEELEEDAKVGWLEDFTLTPEEKVRVEKLREELEQVRCRICRLCEPCPVKIPIGATLGTDVLYDHYRTMGPEGFRSFAWAPERVERGLEERKRQIAAIQSCTKCGVCEERCPYGLPIMEMLEKVVAPMQEMVRIWGEMRVLTP